MQVPRAQVSGALFTVLQNAYSWALADPRLPVPAKLGANQQPALFLVKPDEDWTQQGGNRMAMTSYTLQYYALVMVRGAGTPEDPDATCENVIDSILDAIDTAMMPSPPGLGFKQTLGGLVTNAWIEGRVTIDTPVLFQQAAIWIPIKVLVGM